MRSGTHPHIVVPPCDQHRIPNTTRYVTRITVHFQLAWCDEEQDNSEEKLLSLTSVEVGGGMTPGEITAQTK